MFNYVLIQKELNSGLTNNLTNLNTFLVIFIGLLIVLDVLQSIAFCGRLVVAGLQVTHIGAFETITCR